MKSFIRPRSNPSVALRPFHEGDAIPFESLCERGLAEEPQRWVHYFFVPDAEAADEAIDELRTDGWHVESASAMPEPFPGWSLRVCRDVVITVDLLNEARATHEAVAAQVGGSYAGWDVRPAPRHSRAPQAPQQR